MVSREERKENPSKALVQSQIPPQPCIPSMNTETQRDTTSHRYSPSFPDVGISAGIILASFSLLFSAPHFISVCLVVLTPFADLFYFFNCI